MKFAIIGLGGRGNVYAHFAKEYGNGFETITINMTETLYSMVEENMESYIIKKLL